MLIASYIVKLTLLVGMTLESWVDVVEAGNETGFWILDT